MSREARRREFLRATGGALATGSVIATSGCLGVITGSEPAEFSASVASVPESTLESTGFEENRIEPMEITREFTVAGQTREVVVTNQIAEYDKAAEVLGERIQASLFVALSTPAVEVAGRTFNPIAEMGTRELARQLLSQYDGISNLQDDGEETVEVLGTDSTVGLFTADATVAEGITTEVRLHVSEAIRTGEDFVVTVGAYPTQLSGQAEDVRTMMRSVEHDGE
ncbi:DUF6517 family protein [Halobaculum sp. CBA1158]|uniref:DUF6517 family protein n=1 Tax=Halobaculum sp. CBA1158 TaxID=2904243 RepID=UPI001F3AB133|nr:DUF6517 family protein [Halobaculum sp. CBA1158]UIP01089.1 DUF6517 family protein [Halobaculum sp. CBA1158]